MRSIVLGLLALSLGFAHPALAADGLFELALAQGLGADQVGFVVLDAEDGQVLAEHQGDRGVVPASVAKLPTAIAALAVLGADHRFETELAIQGSTLVLVGGGDPLLTPEDLRPAFRRLKERGARIERFLYDASVLPEMAEIDPAQPENSSYNPGIGALALDFNRVLVDWKAGGREASAMAVSDGARLRADGIRLLLSPAPVPPPYRFLSEGPDRWLLANLPTAGRAWLPVKRPALNAALVIRRLAEREGVSLPMPAAGIRPANAQRLHLHESPRLAEVVRRLLEHSNNMAAEMVGLGTAARLRGTSPASLADSVTTVDAWLRSAVAEVDWTGFARANHSGLSPASRTTPRQMAGLVLKGLVLVPELPEVLPAREVTDPEGGEGAEGDPKTATTLAVRAKTGTMAYARGLVGLLWTHSGRRVAFAVFTYDDSRRIAFDATLDRRVPEMPAAATAWIRRARNLERGLLRSWAAAF